MGWRDRQYARYEYDSSSPSGRGGGVLHGMPRPQRVVGWLLGINIGVFFLEMFAGDFLMEWFALAPDKAWQVWRFVSFQFLHADFFHLLFNMLGLYFLGMMLESAWGARRFLAFYLSCGAAGGLLHLVLAPLLGAGGRGLIGASGGVYGIILACAILFPHVKLILFIFPMPIRFFALLYMGLAVFNVVGGLTGRGGPSQASDPAHLGGAALGVLWVLAGPGIERRIRHTGRSRTLQKLQKREARNGRRQAEIDRILDKIHERGLHSLSWYERRRLRGASRDQHHRNDG